MTISKFGLLLSGCILAGCNRHDTSPAGQKSLGRYAGIGTFEAGRLWQEMKGAPTSQDKSAATLADDEHVIVVLDSHTGEIRQCGDHSGFCVGMNPWATDAKTFTAPVSLARHAAHLPAQDKADNAQSFKR